MTYILVWSQHQSWASWPPDKIRLDSQIVNEMILIVELVYACACCV